MNDMEILIIKLGAIGDVLRTTFVARGLKEKYPQCSITWLTQENSKSLLENNDSIDFIVGWNSSNTISGKVFDIVYSLDDEQEACEFATNLAKKTMHGAYLDAAGKKTYTESVEDWFGMGLLRSEEKGGKARADELKMRNRRTFQDIYSQIFGIQGMQNKRPTLNLTEAEKRFGETLTEPYKKAKSMRLIGINAGAGARWPLKRLTVEKAAQLCNELAKDADASIFLLGGANEDIQNRSIKSLCPSERIVLPEATDDIRIFSSIINAMDLIITADSLALHIALALKKKTVCFFGPTSPWEIDMFGDGRKVFSESDCLACYKKELNGRQSCIDLVMPEQLVQAAKELLPA